MRFGVLGPVAAWTTDGGKVEIRESKVRALLAVLLLSPGRPVPAGQLIDALWGADLPVHPAGALQGKVSRLRQALEAGEPGSAALVAFRSSAYLLQIGDDALDERRSAVGRLSAGCRPGREPEVAVPRIDRLGGGNAQICTGARSGLWGSFPG